MIVGIDTFADVVQERGEEQVFVPRAGFAGKFKNLQRMIKHIAFRVRFAILQHAIERQEEGEKVMVALIKPGCIARVGGFFAGIGSEKLIECLADFEIGGDRFRRNAAASNCSGSPPFGLMEIAFTALCHEPCSFETDLATQSFWFHLPAPLT